MTFTRVPNTWMACGVFVGIMSAAIPHAAQAGPILYDTFGPGDTFAAAPYGIDGAGFQAFHFVPIATGTLEQITVALGRTGAAQATTLFDLYTGPSTLALGVLLETFVVANNVAADSTAPFTGAPVTFLSIAMPTLTAGQGYWLSIREPEAANGATSLWFFNDIGASGERLTNLLPSATNLLPAFRVEAAAVPEPATVALVLGGLLVTVRARRRRQQ